MHAELTWLKTGRFLTIDNFPVNVKDMTPSILNMYAFSRNDPINFIDVYGYVPWWHSYVQTSAYMSHYHHEHLAGSLMGC